MRSFAKFTCTGIAALVGLIGLASSTSDLLAVRSDRSMPVEMGVWHADLNKARAYAETNGIPLIAVWSNGEDCAHCIRFECMAMSPVFTEWMKTSGYVFYYGTRSDGPDGPTADGQEGYHGTSFYWCRKKEGSSDPYASKPWPYVRIYWRKTDGTPKVDMFETGAVLDGEYNMIPMPAPQNCTDNPSKFLVAGDDGTYNPSARYFINRMTNGVSGILREYVRDPLVVFADRPDGCYANGQDVALNCLQEGATIYYTTDGTTPTAGGKVYEVPIKFVPPSMTIKAFAVADESKTGNVYTIECRLPKLKVEMMFVTQGRCYAGFEPATADCVALEGDMVEVLMRSIPAHHIHYTLDGSEPTGDSPIYESPLCLAHSDAVRVSAKGFGDGVNFGDSDVVSYAIRRRVKPPEIAVERIGEGPFKPCRVSVSCATEGAMILRRQAYEGWMGVEWQDEAYEGPFIVDHPLELYFFARKGGLEDSAVVSAAVKIHVIPETWAQNYPNFVSKFGSDLAAALGKPTGKVGADGVPMLVWQDYVAGTDPTNERDVFTASITIVDGKVTISYSPELDDARKAMRKYAIWGKKDLMDTNWTEVQEGFEAEYNFFKVSVEMR